jgi:hypothetical protein
MTTPSNAGFGFGSDIGFRNPLNVTAQKVVIVGSTSSGLFVYSPSAGPGNLVASIAGIAGVDPYGNAYPAGIMDQTAGLQIVMQAGVLYFFGVGATAPQIQGVSGGVNGPSLLIQSGQHPPAVTTLPAILQLFPGVAGNQIIGTHPLTVWDPVAGYPTLETWHSLGNIGAGTGMTINRGRYQLTPAGELEIDIQLFCNSAVLTVDQTLNWSTALGAAYLPNIDTIAPLGCSSDQNTGHRSPKLLVNHTTGVVTITIPPMITPGLFGGTAIIPLI